MELPHRSVGRSPSPAHGRRKLGLPGGGIQPVHHTAQWRQENHSVSWNWPTAPGWVLQFGIHHSPLHALHPTDSAEFAYLIYRSKRSQSTSFSAALWWQDLGMEGPLGRSLLPPSSPCSSLPALWWELPQSFQKKTLSSKGLSTLLF